MIRSFLMTAAALLVAMPLVAEAQSFRCVGKDGRRHYGSTVPQECLGQVIEQLNQQGMVIKRIDPEGDEKARAAKEAQAAKKREEEAAAREKGRRNRALLATYSSERDIEDARARALAENAKAVKELETRIEAIRKRQAGHQKELEFYTGKNKPPPRLAEDMNSAEMELKVQEDMLEAKKHDSETINAKYDADKKRYLELTRGGSSSSR
jgi:chromosome segregation ATPase